MLHEKHIRYVTAADLLTTSSGPYPYISFSTEPLSGECQIGTMPISPFIDELMQILFHYDGRYYHVKFIEWADLINCVFTCSRFLSDLWFAMTKEEYTKLMAELQPKDILRKERPNAYHR